MTRKSKKGTSRSGNADSHATSTGVVRKQRGQSATGAGQANTGSAYPLALRYVNGTTAPHLTHSGASDGRITVRHREYIMDIPGSVNFDSFKLSINPGLFSAFPWLSAIASNYETYQFKRLRFTYEPTVPAGIGGVISMALDYDSSEPSPSSKSMLMSMHGAVRGTAWGPIVLDADPANLARFGAQRYIRSGSPAANLDIKTYDVCSLLVGTNGMINDNVVGDLFVDYEVMLFTPEIHTADGASAFSQRIAAGGAGISKTTPLGQTPTINGNLGVTVDPAGSVLTFPRVGQYLLEWYRQGTTIAGSPTVTPSNCTVAAIGDDTINAAATAANGSWTIDVPVAGATIALAAAAYATLTGGAVRIAPYRVVNA